MKQSLSNNNNNSNNNQLVASARRRRQLDQTQAHPGGARIESESNFRPTCARSFATARTGCKIGPTS